MPSHPMYVSYAECRDGNGSTFFWRYECEARNHPDAAELATAHLVDMLTPPARLTRLTVYKKDMGMCYVPDGPIRMNVKGVDHV
jgi:hypothetical protein